MSSENSPSISPNTSRPTSEIFESSESYQPENITQNEKKMSNVLEHRLKEEFGGYKRIFRLNLERKTTMFSTANFRENGASEIPPVCPNIELNGNNVQHRVSSQSCCTEYNCHTK